MTDSKQDKPVEDRTRDSAEAPRPPDAPETVLAGIPPLARPTTLFSPRFKMGFVFTAVAIGLAYFAWTALDSATVNFNNVADVAAMGVTDPDRSIGVIGKLVGNSYVRSADGITASFRLVDEDGTEQVHVSYRGEIGQVFFNDHSEIILQGRKGADDVFIADTLTVRCPTKYLTEQEQAEIEAQNDGSPAPPPYQPDYFSKNPA